MKRPGRKQGLFYASAVVRLAQFMNSINHGTCMLGIDARVDAMAKIKDVAVSVAEALQCCSDFFANSLFRSIQHTGIKIALQCDPIPDAATCIAQVDPPEGTLPITTTVGHTLQPLAPVFGEQDDRYIARGVS